MTGEEFSILYVLDRVGEGAESYLYLPGVFAPPDSRTLNQCLNSS